jgi:hypothetical protein
VARTAVNVPYWDQWQLAPLLLDWMHGQLDPRDLWAQHNEHRLVFPRLAMLGLARLSGWNVRWEIAASIVANLLTLALLARALVQAVRPVHPALAPWLVLAASLLTFSPSQWENWTWGWQLQIFMNLLAIAGMAALLVDWDGRWPRLVACLVLAAVALGSFASGLVVMVLLPVAAAAWPGRTAFGTRRPQALAATLACAAMTAAYFTGFQYPPHHPTPAQALAQPLAYGAYVLAYLGAGLCSWDWRLAAWWGGGGLLALAGLALHVATAGPGYRRGLAVALFLGAYAVLNATMTGLGRAGVGVGHALSARYISISAFFWVGVALLGSLAAARALSGPAASERVVTRRLVLAGALGGVLSMAALGYARSWAVGQVKMREQRTTLRSLRACLNMKAGPPPSCLARLSPLPGKVVEVATALRAHGLGPLR